MANSEPEVPPQIYGIWDDRRGKFVSSPPGTAFCYIKAFLSRQEADYYVSRMFGYPAGVSEYRIVELK